jgi:hypothetical protein
MVCAGHSQLCSGDLLVAAVGAPEIAGHAQQHGHWRTSRADQLHKRALHGLLLLAAVVTVICIMLQYYCSSMARALLCDRAVCLKAADDRLGCSFCTDYTKQESA